jgi:hypothetical protein
LALCARRRRGLKKSIDFSRSLSLLFPIVLTCDISLLRDASGYSGRKEIVQEEKLE